MVYPRLRDLREDADLTQREMAEALHCSQQAYSNYELGQRDIPTESCKTCQELSRPKNTKIKKDSFSKMGIAKQTVVSWRPWR